MSTGVEDEAVDVMSKKKTTPVRLSDEAILWARRASGLSGESMAEYVSRIVAERAREDVDRLYGEIKSEPKPPKKRGPK